MKEMIEQEISELILSQLEMIEHLQKELEISSMQNRALIRSIGHSSKAKDPLGFLLKRAEMLVEDIDKAYEYIMSQ